MCRWRKLLGAVVSSALLAPPATAAERAIGTEASAEEIARWDIDVRPDGRGLPPGQGTAAQGEEVYQERCAVCHGEFGEAVGRWPQLIGGQGTLASDNPVKTPTSYWPYATTIFDYIRRAMPFGDAQSLTPDEVYGITAFILASDGIIADDQKLDADTLAKVAMPNADGFIDDPRPDVAMSEPCMRGCATEVVVTGHARKIDVTPEEAGRPATE